MSFCGGCGKPLIKGDGFCTNCGRATSPLDEILLQVNGHAQPDSPKTGEGATGASSSSAFDSKKDNESIDQRSFLLFGFSLSTTDDLPIVSMATHSRGNPFGLKSGDQVLGVNGRVVTNRRDFYNILHDFSFAEPIKFEFLRDGAKFTTVLLPLSAVKNSKNEPAAPTVTSTAYPITSSKRLQLVPKLVAIATAIVVVLILIHVVEGPGSNVGSPSYVDGWNAAAGWPSGAANAGVCKGTFAQQNTAPDPQVFGTNCGSLYALQASGDSWSDFKAGWNAAVASGATSSYQSTH